MNSFEITIGPDWITSGYYLYVVRIDYKQKQYFYIGQTGDNHYHTARAPLYRIGGHFAKGTSTENQIVKYFKSKILENDNETPFELEQKLKKSSLKYKFWKICDYDPTDDKVTEHKAKRMLVQAIEHYIIHKLQDRKELVVFNKKVNGKYSKSKLEYYQNEMKAVDDKALTILKELGYEA